MNVHGKTMLCVDESEISRLLQELYFAELGFTIDMAADGAMAVAIAEVCRPDIVLVSLTLPEPVDAYEVIRRIKSGADTANARVIAVESAAPIGALEKLHRRTRAFAAGADMFVCKPCMPDKLAAHVRELLTEPSAA